MKQLALGNDVRAPIIRVVMVRTVVTPGNSGSLITLNPRKGRQKVHDSFKYIHEKKLSVCLSVEMWPWNQAYRYRCELGRRTVRSRRKPMIRQPAGWRGHRSPGWSTECSSSVQSERQALGNCLEENNQLMLILGKRGRYSELVRVGSYQFHKQPLKPTCSGLPLCTEPAGEYLNHWQTHFLLSNKTWHRWCCNPLTKRWKTLTKEDYRILIKEPFTQRMFHPVTTKNFLDKAFLCYTVWGVKMCNFRWWHCSTYPQILYTTECIKNSCRAVGIDIYVIIVCTCSKSCWKQVADCFIIIHTHKATHKVLELRPLKTDSILGLVNFWVLVLHL